MILRGLRITKREKTKMKTYRIMHIKKEFVIIEIEASDAKEAKYRVSECNEGKIIFETWKQRHEYNVLNDYENEFEPEV
jgi:hypothetical protein